MTSWERLVAGSAFGEALIPFRPEESHLITHLTGEATPRMPLSLDPLPEGEINLIRQWIAEGACNDYGVVPYSERRDRIYVVNQGSDALSVIDPSAKIVTRLIDVGQSSSIEAPHNVHIDRQARYGYVSVLMTGMLVKFDVDADSVVGRVRAGSSPAHPVTSPDGSIVYVTDWNAESPAIHVFDAATLTEKYSLGFPAYSGALPHGLSITRDGRYLLSAHEGSDNLHLIEVAENPDDALITTISLGSAGQRYRPFIALLDAQDRYAYVPCNMTGDVRVVEIASAQVVKVIEIGGAPISGGVSPDGRYVFVANWGKDAVDVIGTETQSLVRTISNEGLESPVFAHPHAVAFSSDGRFAFVTNENTNGVYPQHHATGPGGRDGNVAIIDVETFQVVRVLDVEVDPTGIALGGR
jgi:YVTN family beta-propeller protein